MNEPLFVSAPHAPEALNHGLIIRGFLLFENGTGTTMAGVCGQCRGVNGRGDPRRRIHSPAARCRAGRLSVPVQLVEVTPKEMKQYEHSQ